MSRTTPRVSGKPADEARPAAKPPAGPTAKPAGGAAGLFGLSVDRALGLIGCSLAAASATFGVAMTMHGPVTGLGHSGEFTVFAQLAPRRAPAEARPVEVADTGDLDDTTTASIPRRTTSGAASAVTLRAAGAGAATIVIGGRETVVRVGDLIPGIGEVLAIMPGERPWLRTTGGLIAAAAPER